MIAFEPSDDQKMVRDSVAQFAERTLRPRMREFEKARGLPDDVLKAAHEMGLGLAVVPGGARRLRSGQRHAGAHRRGARVAAIRRCRSRSAGPAPTAGRPSSSAGRSARRRSWLRSPATDRTPASARSRGARRRRWPTAPGSRRRAEKAADGRWTLTGEKAYVLNADRAQSFIVFAQVDASKGWDGLGAFVVPARRERAEGPAARHDAGPRRRELRRARRSTGVDGATTTRASTHGGDTPQRSSAFFAKQALLVAARGVGLARAAFDVDARLLRARARRSESPSVTSRRWPSPSPTARWTSRPRARWSGARRGCGTRPRTRTTARSTRARRCCTPRGPCRSRTRRRCARGDDAVQLHGGVGLHARLPGREVDARRQAAAALRDDRRARRSARRRPRARLARSTPALVLPSAESQNVFI